jgi:hypothetical protein
MTSGSPRSAAAGAGARGGLARLLGQLGRLLRGDGLLGGLGGLHGWLWGWAAAACLVLGCCGLLGWQGAMGWKGERGRVGKEKGFRN